MTLVVGFHCDVLVLELYLSTVFEYWYWYWYLHKLHHLYVPVPGKFLKKSSKLIHFMAGHA